MKVNEVDRDIKVKQMRKKRLETGQRGPFLLTFLCGTPSLFPIPSRSAQTPTPLSEPERRLACSSLRLGQSPTRAERTVYLIQSPPIRHGTDIHRPKTRDRPRTRTRTHPDRSNLTLSLPTTPLLSPLACTIPPNWLSDRPAGWSIMPPITAAAPGGTGPVVVVVVAAYLSSNGELLLRISFPACRASMGFEPRLPVVMVVVVVGDEPKWTESLTADKR